MKIRKAQPKDATDIRALIIAAHDSNREDDFDEQGWVRFLSRNEIPVIKDRITDGSYLVLCCLVDNRIAGVIGIYNNDYIYYLLVDPLQRRKGIASSLWELARDICVKRSEVERFWVRSSSMALPAYEKFGFKRSGERETQNGTSYYPMELEIGDSC